MIQRSEDYLINFRSLRVGYEKYKKDKDFSPELNGSARNGELIAVIGRNGIGKSTLLKTLSGILPALGGSVIIDGLELNKVKRNALAKMVGFISTDVIKTMNMTVYELVALGRFPYTDWTGQIDSVNHSIICKALHQTSMTDYSKRFLSELSDGERQKAMIARLLAQETDLMIMDEPTAFLDIGSKFEIVDLLIRLAKDQNRTIVFSTHDFDIATHYADKIWLISDEGLTEGSPEDVMAGNKMDHLFVNSPVTYNSGEGKYLLSRKGMGKIYIDKSGPFSRLLSMAATRAGYDITERLLFPQLKTEQGEILKIILDTGSSQEVFSSFYDLVARLKTIPQTISQNTSGNSQ